MQEPAAQIEAAEKWLEKRPDDAILLLSIGRLYRQSDAMEKARRMIEASIKAENSPSARLELAGILDRLGETVRSHQILIELSTDDKDIA